MQVLHTETGDSKYRPSVLLSVRLTFLLSSFFRCHSHLLSHLQRMVSAGYMGKKSGKGFYDYGLAQEEKPIMIPGQGEVEAEGDTPAPYGESEMKA